MFLSQSAVSPRTAIRLISSCPHDHPIYSLEARHVIIRSLVGKGKKHNKNKLLRYIWLAKYRTMWKMQSGSQSSMGSLMSDECRGEGIFSETRVCEPSVPPAQWEWSPCAPRECTVRSPLMGSLPLALPIRASLILLFNVSLAGPFWLTPSCFWYILNI